MGEDRVDEPETRVPSVTVLTATHDRGEYLRRVYDSLLGQTFTDFEWLIVDDGSTDGTEQIVGRWQKDAHLDIRYIKKEHTGMTGSFNRGYREARGGFLVQLDSDDACLPVALERFLEVWGSIPESERGRFSGVTCLCLDQHGRLIGTGLPQPVMDTDYLELRYRYKVRGERWHFRRTEILRRFPLPEGVAVFQEGVAKARIAREYQERHFDEPLRIYWQDETGGMDQVSRRHPIEIAPGLAYLHRTILNEQFDWFREAPFEFFRSALHYARFSFHEGIPARTQVCRMSHLPGRALWCLMAPLGYLCYLRDRGMP